MKIRAFVVFAAVLLVMLGAHRAVAVAGGLELAVLAAMGTAVVRCARRPGVRVR